VPRTADKPRSERLPPALSNSNALRPAPGPHDWSFLVSWAPTRVSICFSRRADRSDGEDFKFVAGEAKGVVRGGRRVRDRSLQRRLAEPVVARGRSVRRLVQRLFDAPRPAPGRDTVRQRSWPGRRTELLAEPRRELPRLSPDEFPTTLVGAAPSANQTTYVCGSFPIDRSGTSFLTTARPRRQSVAWLPETRGERPFRPGPPRASTCHPARACGVRRAPKNTMLRLRTCSTHKPLSNR